MTSRKITVLSALLLIANTLCAQPWAPKANYDNIPFKEIVREFREELHEEAAANRESEGDEKYQFERWAWYWGRHLDSRGYMVSSSKTWEEWKAYLDKNGIKSSNKTTASSANWIFRGPDYSAGGYSGVGRINCIALHPTNSRVIFVGSAGGGVWKSDDLGTTWKALYANLPTLGVSDIVVNPLNPDIIYVCTGDANGYGTSSMGVIKTMDGGTTWSVCWAPPGFAWTRSLVMNPQDTATLILGASTGMYVTHNSGATWVRTDTGDYVHVLYKPNDTTVVYGAKYPTWPASTSQIMRSTNGGVSWGQVTSLTGAQRIALAVTPANNNLVMALVSQSGTSGMQSILESTNSGASFSAIYRNDTPGCRQNLLDWSLVLPTSNCGGQGWYDLCIAIDPTDANKVIVGGVNAHYSTDRGRNWSIVNGWWAGVSGLTVVHADKHAFVYSPLDGSLYQACDGGIYRTTNPSGTWADLSNGLAITQFYRNAVASGTTACLGGAQDNGTKLLNGTTYSDLTGGDGMQCRIDWADPRRTWYTSTQFGGLSRTFNGGTSFANIRRNVPDTTDGAWISPYIIHPRYNTSLLFGLDQLYATDDRGNTWRAISPVFGRGDLITDIAMSQASDDYIYIRLSDNTVRFSPDYGTTWTTIPTSGFSNDISRLAVDPRDKDILWASFTGYATEKVAYYNRRTLTWTAVNGTLPNIPVNSIIIDSFSHTKYIATDVAVFYMDTTMSDWALYNANLPSVEVIDLNINYETGELWAATYGRGMWKTVKRDLPNSISIVPYKADMLVAHPNPTKGTFTLSASDGSKFAGERVKVKVMDVTGKIVWSNELEFDTGGRLLIDANGLKPGIYICETANNQLVARCQIAFYP